MKTKFNVIKELDDFGLIQGIKCCLDNSQELHDSAIILKDNNIYSTSISLLILSVEELMKSFALFQMLILDREVYRDIFESNDLHTSRHHFAMFFNEYFKCINFDELLELEIQDNQSEEIVFNQILENIDINNISKNISKNFEKEKLAIQNWFLHANSTKNNGLYVAYNKKWFSPNRLNKKNFEIAYKETELIRHLLNLFLQGFVSREKEEIANSIDYMKLLAKKLISNQEIDKV